MASLGNLVSPPPLSWSLVHMGSLWAGLLNPLIPRSHSNNELLLLFDTKNQKNGSPTKMFPTQFFLSETRLLPQQLLRPISSHPSPSQLVLLPFFHPEAPLNPLVSPCSTSTYPCQTFPFSLQHFNLPVVAQDLSPSNTIGAWEELRDTKSDSLMLKRLIRNRLGNFSIHMDFGDTRWLLGLSSILLPKFSPQSP